MGTARWGALCSTQSSLFQHRTAGAGSDTVNDASTMLDVQLWSAGTTGSTGIGRTQWWWSRRVTCTLGVKLTPISLSISIASMRAGYEYVGDDDSILDVLSRRTGDARRAGDDGTNRGVLLST